MSWNHRVLRREYEDGTVLYNIYEVFYNDETGEAWGCTVDPVYAQGEDVDDLRRELEWMLEATEHPVLDWDSFDDKTDAD